MEFNLLTIIFTIINIAVVVAIITGIYKAIQTFKDFVNRSNNMENKIDIILDKLENKEAN
ncbi:hypothetical protein LGL08_16785 [Clostridium estertheticum]|uniref:hypothetical protein n=1 Tax=Clostridium estertheticum TaxID=238834 RepID=UPI001CF179CD|nr:hypothetical protein [Clostridium estertheticum]MCB2307747.1 hypothetical protein [Clostridium estertheticum]MCB2345923.1 hypothetical protein [Clostridium estertheticum]MCB2351181.1 hypothetical protein [Clostridium estertheticum]WAG44726.1 hypothetical protein LL127_14290 [Clostridium estertheticum]